MGTMSSVRAVRGNHPSDDGPAQGRPKSGVRQREVEAVLPPFVNGCQDDGEV